MKEKIDMNEKIQKGTIFDLAGKVALVTGGASGLGRVFCMALAEFGADIALADVDEAGSRQTLKEINALERRSLAVKADVSNPDAVRQMIAAIMSKFGRIDILINNAGISAKAVKIAEMDIADWDRVMSVNLRGVFLCTRAVLPVMEKQRRGVIINIASVKGIRPLMEITAVRPKAHYTVAKAGVISLTKETALEYGGAGIRVNCIAPGWHEGTRLNRWREDIGIANQTDDQDEIVRRITPLGRMGNPDELKGLLIYLASDASSFVTGQVFVSDGGICI